jgi:transposase
MVSHTASPRDWKEARRWRGLELKRGGWSQRQIAQALGVSEAAVSQWFGNVNELGECALRARPRPGAPLRLGQVERLFLPELLSQGAEAYGFRGNIWTCGRVAKVIEWEFGVTYHKAHVSRLLKDLEWTPQKPIERALQRNEALIESWRTDVWPELKKRRAVNAEPWYL